MTVTGGADEASATVSLRTSCAQGLERDANRACVAALLVNDPVPILFATIGGALVVILIVVVIAGALMNFSRVCPFTCLTFMSFSVIA